MATPAFRAVTAKSAATTGTNAPGLPSGVAANDIVLLIATVNTGATISIQTAGSITWNAVTGSPFDVAGGEKLYVWWGRYVSGATGPTLSAASDADHSVAATIAYSGCIDTGSPIDSTGIASSSEATSDTSFSFATGVSSTAHNALCICIATSGVDSNTGQIPVMTNAALAALASRANYQTASGGGGGFGLTDGTLAGGGSMGTFACTYGGASPKAYVAFALMGGKSASVAQTETVTQTVTGVRTRLGILSQTLTVVQTLTGAHTGVGSAARAQTVTQTADGTRIVLGAAARAEAVTQTLSGSHTGIGVVSQTQTVAQTVDGVRTTYTSLSQTLIVTQNLEGIRTVDGALSQTITVTQTVVGIETAEGIVLETLTVSQTISGLVIASGEVAQALMVSQTVDGVRVVAGVVVQAEGVTLSVAGTRTAFAAANLVETVAQLVGTGAIYGIVSQTLSVESVATGTRAAVGAAARTQTVTQAIIGTRTLAAQVSQTLTVTQTIIASVLGTSTLPITVTQTIIVVGANFPGAVAGHIVWPSIDTTSEAPEPFEPRILRPRTGLITR